MINPKNNKTKSVYIKLSEDDDCGDNCKITRHIICLTIVLFCLFAASFIIMKKLINYSYNLDESINMIEYITHIGNIMVVAETINTGFTLLIVLLLFNPNYNRKRLLKLCGFGLISFNLMNIIGLMWYFSIIYLTNQEFKQRFNASSI